jgi:uncharacterized protein DUF4279
MNPFEYKVSLRLQHPSMNPDEISAALSLKPKQKWKAGEQRKTPTGIPLEGNREESYWCCDMDHPNGVELSEFLETLTKKLKEKKEFLAKIRSTGGSTEFFIGWFSRRNSGDIFDWKLLKTLAELQINLSFDVYGEPGT